MPLRAVIFDLDGTLVDSAPSIHRAVARMMESLDLPVPDLPTVIGFIGNGVPTLIERCMTWAEAGPRPEAEPVFRAIYDADPITGVEVFEGVQALLSALRQQDVKTALCTNKPEAPTRTLVEGLRLGPFDVIVGGDTLPLRKPDPAPLLHALMALGVTREEAVYVGDSAIDWQTARAAQVPYLHLDGGYQNGTLDGLDPARCLPDMAALGRSLQSA